LIEFEQIQKYDSENMLKIYDFWPEMAYQQLDMDSNELNLGECSHIIFAGMGGSGSIGDIFAAILSKTNIHVEVVKGYVLPKTVNSKSLVITISISGNTEETLSILSMANNLKCKILAFSDGGKMEQYCEKNNINHHKIEMKHSPRSSFPIFLFSILKILEPFLPINKNDIMDSLQELKKQRDKIGTNNLTNTNPAISLAEWISEIPMIYYPYGLQASAIRFKNSLQENAKIHAISEDVIEACHNGIVPWSKSKNLKPILIRGKDDYFKTDQRWEILKEYFKKEGVEYKEIFSVSGNILSKLINLVYFFDYVSIYVAILSETDPTPVDSIKFVKDRL
jgi:glucose/mannose-6-phosphate isomerase